jgi:H+/Na+-translocating ferredoxin:NAD+ oxidoreductase subunit G
MSARRDEVLRIAASMTVACAIGAALLGGVYVATARYQEAARDHAEQHAVASLLGLGPRATVRQVRQLLDPRRGEVLYRTGSGTSDSEYVFTLDGLLARRGAVPAGASERGLIPAGRLFLAREDGAPRGFVIEGDTRGYKNRIRFFVGLDRTFRIAGVEVLEHEEDPGLGAEVATPWFEGQFVGRSSASLESLTVTRDPMPEDWRAALLTRGTEPGVAWQDRHRALVNRMIGRPIYAVTGATISSRALTDGVRGTVAHFRRRWELLAPYLASSPEETPHVP